MISNEVMYLKVMFVCSLVKRKTGAKDDGENILKCIQNRWSIEIESINILNKKLN